MEDDKDSFFSKQFDTWKDFEDQFERWCTNYHQPVNIKRSSKMYNEKTMKELFDRFRYEYVKYVCHHNGLVRRNTKDGSRPNQESARIECGFFFKIKHDTDINKITFMNIKNLTHYHPIDERIYKNYSFIRNKELSGNKEAHDLCKVLISANVTTYNSRKVLKEKFDLNLTRKDMNNLKQKMKFDKIGNLTDPDLLRILINDVLQENPNNSIEIKSNKNGNLDCLYIQTMQMKSWLRSYPNILHIDSTFKVNIENYQLYICMAQNANLNGVPVAYCLMASDTKENLEFFYSSIHSCNDLQQTQVVMVDKDLSNIDVLKNYFVNARVLLCIFHVLKYLKLQVHQLKIPLPNRMNIMKNIRRLLYDNNQMSAIYLQEIRRESEDTNFYQYFEINWLSCCEMWQTKYRKNLLNFDTNTNKHLERFNRTLKDRISSNMHISECIPQLLSIAEDVRIEEINAYVNLKQKIYSDDDSAFLKRFGVQLVNKAIDLLRQQNEELKTKHYFIEELEEKKWKIGQKDCDTNHFITSSIISHDSNGDLFFCDCDFFFQNQLPCRHVIFLFGTLEEETSGHTKTIQEFVSINKRWLKTTADDYLDEAAYYESKQTLPSQYKTIQPTLKKTKVLSTSNKYNIVKPTLDLLAARITQCGTDEFNDHLTFLNTVLDLISVNRHRELYSYATDFECKDRDKPKPERDLHFIPKSCDNTQQESSTEQTMFNNGETVEKKQETNISLEALEKENEINLPDEQEASPSFELLQEAKHQEQSLSVNQSILSYSPVINPRGRPRGRTSLVSYKTTSNKAGKENKKRAHKQVSPDLKTYHYKRNKKLESVRDVGNSTTWLTDFHIYLFFELLKKQFPNINGLCGPAQIHLYKDSLDNSIFIFNADNNHWLTIANLESQNRWNVYDSLCYPKESLVKFFQDILPDEEKVVLSFENVQRQVGGHDCGLFALAFATSFRYGDIPSTLFYDQKSLRNHYISCLENNTIQRFPSKPKRENTRNGKKLVDLSLK